MVYKILPLVASILFSFLANTAPKSAIVAKIEKTTKSALELKIASQYQTLQSHNATVPQIACFDRAMNGFYALKAKGLVTKNIITIVDFSLSSNVKRLWVIDLDSSTVLFNSLVAHGRNSGEEFAKTFSNAGESYKSSLGFYATGEIYNGKHGMSLKLDGLEKGVNDNARDRAVVMHGADYVSESFIKNNHRLGRSLGCPALPEALNSKVIEVIKNKSCLFIYHPSQQKRSLPLFV